jgi:RNA polymerase subunit RPABC4/transcription elongation factor Spt4
LVLAFVRKVESSPQIGVYAAFLLVVFLGLFSLGLLTRWRGLLFTVGGILLVGFFMQLAARFRAKEPPSPPVSLEEEGATVVEAEMGVEEIGRIANPAGADTHQVAEETFEKFCPRCGRGLLPDYTFCPGCGHDERAFLACQHCGRQHYAADRESLAFCPSCGTAF